MINAMHVETTLPCSLCGTEAWGFECVRCGNQFCAPCGWTLPFADSHGQLREIFRRMSGDTSPRWRLCPSCGGRVWNQLVCHRCGRRWKREQSDEDRAS